MCKTLAFGYCMTVTKNKIIYTRLVVGRQALPESAICEKEMTGPESIAFWGGKMAEFELIALKYVVAELQLVQYCLSAWCMPRLSKQIKLLLTFSEEKKYPTTQHVFLSKNAPVTLCTSVFVWLSSTPQLRYQAMKSQHFLGILRMGFFALLLVCLCASVH